MRVQTAGAGQHPQRGRIERFFLLPRSRLRSRERQAVGADAQQRYKPRPVVARLRSQVARALHEFIVRELVSARRSALNQIGESIAEFLKLAAFARREQAICEPHFVKRRPEAIAGAREVIARRARVKAGIDAAEQHLEIRRDDIRDGLADGGSYVGLGRSAYTRVCTKHDTFSGELLQYGNLNGSKYSDIRRMREGGLMASLDESGLCRDPYWINDRDEPIYGNPEKFFGPGIVGFIDLLGFGRAVLEQWGRDDPLPLKQLQQIKRAALSSDEDIRGRWLGKLAMSPGYRSRVLTISDSFVVSTALPTNYNQLLSDLPIALTLTVARVRRIMDHALREGFVCRGVMELNPIYWDSEEVIGSALVLAHHYEGNGCAAYARVIVGPWLLFDLARCAELVEPEESKSISDMFTKFDDGLIGIKPGEDSDWIRRFDEVKGKAGAKYACKYAKLRDQGPPSPV